MRVAIVDDECDIRNQLSRYLQRYGKEHQVGFVIVEYDSGDSLLQEFNSDFSLILFDIDMPGTNSSPSFFVSTKVC